MARFSGGLKWDRRKLKKPCFGIFLPTSVKTTTIVNGFVAVASMIIFGVGIHEHIDIGAYNKLEKWEQAVRPLFWAAYYCYWVSDIFLSIVLYAACKHLNFKSCKRWFWIQSGLLVTFLTIFSLHCSLLVNLNEILRAVLGVLGFYKVYTIWVVYCFMQWLKGKSPYELEVLVTLSEADLEEFEHGNESETPRRSGRIQKPYDRLRFEITMEHLNDRSTWIHLSQTDFSSVYKAIYRKPGHAEIFVAVKTIRTELEYFKTQLCEFKIRTEIGDHENIVALIGANTSNIRNRVLELVVEFCPLGNLEFLLQNTKNLGTFKNQLDTFGRFRGSSWDSAGTSLSAAFPLLNMPIPSVSTVDLVRWSLQIAKGMSYLHEMKIIHGDLAPRNILLTAEKIAKVNDFGLSKCCYSYKGYVRSKEKSLPFRLMAPECFGRKVRFSFMSDVWAYGVTLWEIFSLGEIPYSYLDAPDQRFVYGLKTGTNPGNVACPKYAPAEIYKIMKSCWNLNPKERPSFPEIVNELDSFLGKILAEEQISCPNLSTNKDCVVVISEDSNLNKAVPIEGCNLSLNEVKVQRTSEYKMVSVSFPSTPD